MKSKSQVINLEKINVNALPELQGWKEKQELILKENPFLEITDNATFIEAKKRRTALVKGRTTIQIQDKLIASKLKEFRSKVAVASSELIDITIEAEEKQQEEVKRYESKKETERLEKIRLEEERKNRIKTEIESVFNEWKEKITSYSFKEVSEVNIIEELSNIDSEKFEEFSAEFNEKTRILTQLFSNTKVQLEKEENQRLEALRLEEERKKFEEEKRIEKERLEKEQKERAEKQALIDAENEKKQKEIELIERELKAEKERLLKIENERIEKEKKEEELRLAKEKKEREENQAKIDAEIKAKREKALKRRENALKPDKEKLSKLIDSIKVTADAPDLKNKKLKVFLNHVDDELEDLKKDLHSFLNALK